MRNTAQWWMASCLITTFFVGCGSSAPVDDGTGTAAMTATPATTTGATAAAGSGAGAAGGGAPGLGGVMMLSEACGTATCSGVMFAGMGAMPCCVDPAAGTCGNMMGGTCVAKPAVAENCPKIAPVFGMQVNSCCRDNGECGVDGSALGQGCTDYSGLARFGVMTPAPTMCDGTPIMTAGGAAGGGAAGAGMVTSAAGAGAAGAGAAGTSATGAAGSGAAGGAADAGSGAAGTTAAAGSGAAGTSTMGTAGMGAMTGAGAGGM